MFFIFFLIAIGSSIIGAISGIGGGIIIKPVMDAFSGLNVSTISFLSGCTVFSMAISSYIRGLKNEIELNYKITVKLALGAAAGGILGKIVFSAFPDNVALVQSILLFIINIGVFVYISNKNRIKSLNVTNGILCIVIGFLLGFISAFLGIGGGPINIAVLYYFFSMTPKITAKNSLFIILFSQATSLTTTFITRTVPQFNSLHLFVMCLGGVCGAIIGQFLSGKMTDNKVEKFFRIVLIFLIMINTYNIVMFFLK